MVFWAGKDSLAATGRKRPWTPEVRQGEHAECGLAALAILLGHHGVHVPLADLRRQAGSTLFGSTVGQLRDLARGYGFKARAHRTEPDALPALGLPLIAHMRFIHFVVVEHVGETVVHVNDPGCGPVVLDRAEFDRDFTGIALSLEPDAAVPRGKAFSLVRAVTSAWQGQWMRLGLAGAASLTSGTAASAGLWRLASDPEGSAGLPLLAAAVCAAGLALLLTEQANFHTRQRWTDILLHALGRADNAHFLFTRPEQTLTRFSALDGLQDTGLIRALLMALWLLAALGAGCVLAPGPVLPVALLSIVQTALVVRASTRRGGRIARHGHAGLAAQGIAAEHLADGDWYRIGGAGDGLFSHLAGVHARAAADHFRTANAQRRLHTALFALDMAKIVLPLKFFSGAGLVLALGLAGGGSVVIRGIGKLLPSQPLKDALHQLGDLPPPSDLEEEPDSEPPCAGVLRFHDAGWSAGGRHTILANLSCSVSPGHILMVHGPSGSGATTFARLASGLLRLTAGSVTLGGRPLGLHPPGTAILVDHSVLIVPGTLRDNLRLGTEGIDDAALWAALRLVGLDEAIARRGGLSLVLKPDQPRLSGGQMRRIVIARALCRAPRLLVLDEALDAVETALAKSILDGLRAKGLILVVTTKNAELAGIGDAALNLGADDAA